jgi:apolipoprotein N-acyltransferase
MAPRGDNPGHTVEPALLPGRLAAMRGWRRMAVAAGLGLVLAAALPPFYILPAALIALCGFVWMLDGATTYRRAWLDGWLFGVGFSLGGFYWIANALLVEAARYGWMFPFALAAIGAGFALFPAFVALCARLAPAGPPRVVLFALAWVLIEWLRSWILTGFPWNMLGTALGLSDALLQPAAWAGPWSLTGLVLFAALLPAALARDGRLPRRRAFAGLAASLTVLALVWGAGSLRLASHPTTYQEGVVLRLVQPAIAQADKWRSTLLDSHFATHIALSLSQPASEEPLVIVWPEAAIPYQLLRKPTTLAQAAAIVPEGGALLAGAVRAAPDASGVLQPWNSILVIDETGIAATYDKHHLVPFGEYMPLRDALPLDKLTPGTTDFVAGPGPVVINQGKLPGFGPLVCYEVIFPNEIIGEEGRPDWLLNVTNDAWYGVSTGPYQHFQAARLRAVEQGLPMVRVANTGISGIIDPAGRVLASLPLGHRGVLDGTLPAPLSEPTLYARWGDWTLFLTLFPGLLVLAWTLHRLRHVGDGGSGSATRRCQH